MREALESVLGEGGALVVQFVVTLVVVLALIVGVVWLVSRFGGTRFAGQGRIGRAPRLALVDTLAIDGRRRMVLVRRDNVEHLLLIGGPTDIVVEPSIVRTAPGAVRPTKQGQVQSRGQGQPPADDAAPIPPPAHVAGPSDLPPARENFGGSEPVPFTPPPLSQTAARSTRTASVPEQGDDDITIEPMQRGPATFQTAGSAHFADTARPTRIESVFSLAGALDEIADEAVERPSGDDRANPARPSTEAALSVVPAEAGELAAEGTPTAAKVSDLEREMARLLGEITGKRNA